MYTYRRHIYEVYIVTNKNRTVFYTGVTNNLQVRLAEHWFNQDDPKTFAGKYKCHHLVHYEVYHDIKEAIQREKEIKGWNKYKKLDLIRNKNPLLKFLNEQVCKEWPPLEEFRPKRG